MQRASKIALATWTRFNAHGDALAAGISFYSLLSLAPLVVITTTIAGWVFDRQSARQALFKQLERLGAPDLQPTIVRLIDAANGESGGVAAVVATCTLLYAASRLFLHVQAALNLVWEVTPPPKRSTRGTLRALAKKRATSFLMVLSCGALLLVVIVLQAIMTTVGEISGQLFGNPAFTSLIALALNLGVSLALATAVFALIYRVLPDVRLAWSDVWVGAALTSCLMLLGTWLLSIYVLRVAPAWLQGAFGSLAAFMLWTYYQAQVFLLGAAFTRAWSSSRSSRAQ